MMRLFKFELIIYTITIKFAVLMVITKLTQTTFEIIKKTGSNRDDEYHREQSSTYAY